MEHAGPCQGRGGGAPGSAAYYNGDFNLDGRIDADDYALIDFVFNDQGAPM